jgi:hypothetical protein
MPTKRLNQLKSFVMKNLTLFILINIFLFGCQKKKIIYPPIVQSSKGSLSFNIYNTEYVLKKAFIYFESKKTGQIYYYDHFSPTKKISVLDPFTGGIVSMDSLIQDSTTWIITPYNKFILNNSKTFDYKFFTQTISVFGLENGSARPIEIIESSNDYLLVKVGESYVDIDNEPYKFYTVISLKNKKYTGEYTENIRLFNAKYNGVIEQDTTDKSISLKNQNWLVYKVMINYNTMSVNDTLHFKDNLFYSLNSNPYKGRYSLQYILGTGLYSLTIYDYALLGGNYSGKILPNFIKDGMASNIEMQNLYDKRKIYLWIKRI